MKSPYFVRPAKFIFALFSVICSIQMFAQNNDKLTQPIIEEAQKLYRSEMASWHGTDLFMAKYPNRSNIGGYFSYNENKENVNVFFSKTLPPKIIGTIRFDEHFDLSKAKVNLQEREFSSIEKEIHELRQKALQVIQNDTIFKVYNNTSLNLIPLIEKQENKVYVLTGPSVSGVVVFGNDYLLTFDKKNNLKSRKALHKNIIPIEYDHKGETESTAHSHLPETGDFITATDLCTLMLYGKYTGWKTHYVTSTKYISMWNIKENRLFILEKDEKIKNNKRLNVKKD